jgi:hypothetical protein
MTNYRVVGLNNGKWVVQKNSIRLNDYGKFSEFWNDVSNFDGFDLNYCVDGLLSKEDAIELAKNMKEHEHGKRIKEVIEI